ncbi:MAG TPA: filamin/ABP280 repeat domain-containing protein [Gemmatimonadaceae bacterium]|nr:filamin/ABP280 repeat domain-containing protein [Gemmatimonadaceae bacterium]
MNTALYHARAISLALLALVGLLACDDITGPPKHTPESHPLRVTASAAPVIFVGAGDIAGCASTGDERTATVVNGVLSSNPGAAVFAAGDNAYEDGSAADYANCYDPSWGQFKGVTYAAIGNHEYNTGTADPTWDYFGTRAGPRGLGYYSIDLGDWHVVFLNSNQTFVPTAAGSAQEQWLKSDLAATTKQCIVAIWHHPRWYAGHGTDTSPGVRGYVKPFWDDLYAAGAELIINGHAHFYERYAPMDPNGNVDRTKGIRQIIVGTGGRSVSIPTVFWPTSEVHNTVKVYGVLQLTLGSGTYSWQYLPEAGKTFTDSGSGTCTTSGGGGTVSPAQSTATVPNGTAGSATNITVQARDQNGTAITTGGATVVVSVSGANTATPPVTDNNNGTYTTSYTPTKSGTDQVAITMNGTAISGSPYTSTVAPGAPASEVKVAGDNQSATVGTAVAIAPSVRVTDAFGNNVPGVTVTFAVQSGGGSVTGATPTTDANGVATVGSWTLGPTAGTNTLSATAAGLSGSPVTFTATATTSGGGGGGASASQSTATVPNGTAGSATTITVQARDQNGVALTTGGATVVVTVSGANSATPAVTDNNNGTYTASYTPTKSGTDQVAITLNGTPISGSPYASTVVAGAPAVQTIVAGNNQSAPAGTAVPIAPSLRVTDAFGNPVVGWQVLFSVVTGGGSVTGAQVPTDANGVATVGSWILGPVPGKNQLKGRAMGSGLTNTIFNATGT